MDYLLSVVARDVTELQQVLARLSTRGAASLPRSQPKRYRQAS
jgi:hypothetical protein